MHITPELELRPSPAGWGLYLHGKLLSEGSLVEVEIEDGLWIEGHYSSSSNHDTPTLAINDGDQLRMLSVEPSHRLRWPE